MATLEPCLPIWLMENLHPQRWQVGTVFVPDSVGYFVGTNFCAAAALRCGQLRVAVACLLLVGCSCFVVSGVFVLRGAIRICLITCCDCVQIPNVTSVLGLLLPHFTLGLGIGVLDAALVPLLATLVDNDDDDTDDDDETCQNGAATDANYGIVYAIQQMAVSLAYAMAPLLGGEIAQYISFGWLMALVGCANVVYAFVMLWALLRRPNIRLDVDGGVDADALQTSANGGRVEFDADLMGSSRRNYRRFYDAFDVGDIE